MKIHRLLSLFIVLLFVGVLRTSAQDVEVTENPIAIVTEEAAAPGIVCEEGATCNLNENGGTPAPADNSPLAWIAIGLSGLTVILVGFSLWLQRVGNRAEAISNDPSAVSLLERGYDTVLPDMVKSIVQPLKESLERSDQAVDKLLALLNKITDGVPESSKVTPPPASSLSGTTANYTVTPTPPMPDNG